MFLSFTPYNTPMKKLLIFLFISPLILLSSELKPFTTDGCSVFPDGTIQEQSLWLECCIQHDLAYWKGGTLEQKNSADNELETCVKKLGKKKIAKVMKLGVDTGGSAYFPTPYRWAYGWPYLRGYEPLNQKEKKEVKKQLERFELILKSLSKEIIKED